jgi:hypothetical protein
MLNQKFAHVMIQLLMSLQAVLVKVAVQLMSTL